MAISTAVGASAVARTLGIKTIFKDLRGGGILLLPQRIAVVGQGASSATFSTTKAQVTSAAAAGAAYGYGSPIHLAVQQLLPTNGDGVNTIPVTIYPLEDDASGVAATGDITPSGTQTEAAAYIVYVNNIASEEFVIFASDTVATITAAITEAINAVLEMPVIAVDSTTKVDLTSKWKGTSANDIVVNVSGSTTSGTTFAIGQPSGGLVNPDVDDALTQVGDVWETIILNCLELTDTATLDKYHVFGEGRWGALTRKPLVALTGSNELTVAAISTIPDARKTDRTNGVIPAPGSDNLPFVIVARSVARIAVVADNNPAQDYGRQSVDGITPGTDGEQWDYLARDEAIKKGVSSTQVRDGVVNLSDTVTFYHPTGEPIPAYRFVVDIIKLQNIIYNIDLIFNTAEWDGAPLIPNNQPTTNRTAKKPKTAVAAVSAVIDSLGLSALISDPETAKANTLAEIDSGNPKRLNLSTTVQLSGNTNIISVDLQFGFYFGTSTIVA